MVDHSTRPALLGVALLGAMLLGCSPPCDQDARVRLLTMDPPPGRVQVPVDASLVLRFSHPIAPGQGSVEVHGAIEQTTQRWSDDGSSLTVTPLTAWPHLTELTVHTRGLVAVDGRPLPAFSASVVTAIAERLPPAPPSGDGTPGLHFTEVAAPVGLAHPHRYQDTEDLTYRRLMLAGVAAGDVDGDERIDLFLVSGNTAPTALYIGQPDGTWVEEAEVRGVALDDGIRAAPMLADWTGDGALDLVVAGHDGLPTRWFVNDGAGAFTEVSQATGADFIGDAYSTSFGDYDEDGDLDAFFSRWRLDGSQPVDPFFLWRNEGDGRFTSVSTAAGLFALDIPHSLSTVFADIDSDGSSDLLVVGDFGDSQIYLNNGDGTFAVQQGSGLTDENGMGSATGDIDNDGDLDWFVTSISATGELPHGTWGTSGNRLYRNRGDGSFEDLTDLAGVREGGWAWAPCFADLDLDGHLDLFHTNGWLAADPANSAQFAHDPARLFLNRGDGTFTESAASTGLVETEQGRGIVCFDYDRDGDVDLFVQHISGTSALYRNDGAGLGHFLNVRLRGLPPNTEAVGARILVTTGGTTQLRELHAGTHYASNDPVEAVFGVGDARVIDELVVQWPLGGVTVAHEVPVDRFVVIEQLGESPQ